MEIKLQKKDIEKLLDYLKIRPWVEVNDLIHMIKCAYVNAYNDNPDKKDLG